MKTTDIMSVSFIQHSGNAKYDDQLQYKSAALFRGVMASKLISITKSNPQMFDKAALRFKLQLPVKVD